jgi:hypothetical protein
MYRCSKSCRHLPGPFYVHAECAQSALNNLFLSDYLKQTKMAASSPLLVISYLLLLYSKLGLKTTQTVSHLV